MTRSVLTTLFRGNSAENASNSIVEFEDFYLTRFGQKRLIFKELGQSTTLTRKESANIKWFS